MKIRKNKTRPTKAQRALTPGDQVQIRIGDQTALTTVLTMPRRTAPHRWTVWLKDIDGPADLATVYPAAIAVKT